MRTCVFLLGFMLWTLEGMAEGIVMSRADLTLRVGETNRLSAGPGEIILWSSSNPGFATVGADGLVTALHEGSVTVSALSAGGDTAECRVTVLVRAVPVPVPAAASSPRVMTGIVIANEIRGMAVGDDLGIVASCLPYSVFDRNPYTLETSDSNILTASAANVVTAVGTGTVTVTARTPNGKTDSLTFEVGPAPREERLAPDASYAVELDKFGIVPGECGADQARLNTAGINHALLYARRQGYRAVAFPKGLYQLDPAESISMRSGLRVDLNGSTWQIRPNAYARYALVRFREMNGPNLFGRYQARTEPALRPSLSPQPVARLVLEEGRTNLLSEPIPVGLVPERGAADLRALALSTNEDCFLSSPVAVAKTPLDPGKRAYLDIRFKVHYCSNGTIRATQDLGPVWIRNSNADAWCDRPTALRLRSDLDYDAIRLELAFSLDNCRAEVYLDRAYAGAKVSAVLANATLCNGTILGERDFKEPLYPKWREDGRTEGALALSFEEGPSNGVEKLTVRKGIGFNMASRIGQQSAGSVGLGSGAVPVKVKDLEGGGLDAAGQPAEAAGVQRTAAFLDLSGLRGTFELGLPLGYMGYNILRARLYDIYFYNRDKVFLERRLGRLAYRRYTRPADAAFAKLVLHWDMPITAGHPDFNGAFGFLTGYAPPVANFIRNCVIEDNYSCGLAACGGVNWRIEGNVFRRNGGRMPGCDIDWEDGWEYSQDDIVRNNAFESPHGLILCAGVNHVFKNNRVDYLLLAYGRTQHLKFEGNRFGTGGRTNTMTFGAQTDTYIVGNTFTNVLIRVEKEHRDKAAYGPVWRDNTGITNGMARTAP